MFERKEVPFGQYKILRLQHPKSGVTMDVIPELGGSLQGLKLANEVRSGEVIDGHPYPPGPQELGEFRGSILAPFPNRLAAGKYRFKEQDFALSLKGSIDPHNALHGFVWQQPMALEVNSLMRNQTILRLSYDYAGDLEGYPFPFHLDSLMALHVENGLEHTITITNTGNRAMPAGLGVHPYLALSGTPLSLTTLSVPEMQVLLVDDKQVPDGKMEAFDKFQKAQPIGSFTVDSCFYVMKKGDYEICLERKDRAFGVKMIGKAPSDSNGYVQLYRPKDGRSLAVEPMTCAPDAFNNQMGLQDLKPGESLDLTYCLQAY